jgi:hypothetical protein
MLLYSGLENREYGRGGPLCSPHDTFYLQNLALTSPTSGSRSVGIVRSRTEAAEFVVFNTSLFFLLSLKPILLLFLSSFHFRHLIVFSYVLIHCRQNYLSSLKFAYLLLVSIFLLLHISLYL